GTVRARELRSVAEAYGAELELHTFWNAPLPESSFPPKESIAARWKKEGDPVALMSAAIERFRPTVLLTFDPERGFTGHPEHRLAAEYARAAIGRARMRSGVRVDHVYEVLNHFWITRLVGTSDPAEPTETFDTHTACGKPGQACLDVALEITR